MADPTDPADGEAGPEPRALARKCVQAGVDAADPEQAVRNQIAVDGDRLTVGDSEFDLAGYDRVLVAGGGKAAAAVARGLRSVLGDRVASGLVVTDGDTGGLERVDPESGALPEGAVAVAVGDHPVPGERNVAAASRVVDLLEGADEGTLVLAPVTGGGSALLAAPTVPLAEFRDLTEALVESGADIGEINAVRKRLSQVKGGGLAAAAAPATVVALLVSDVVGDDPGVIASGPFVADDTSAEAALAVLERYDIAAPESVRAAIREGGPGGDASNVHTHLLVRTRTAVDAAAERARAAGYDPLVLSSRMRGEAREAALAHVAVAEECLAEGDPAAPPAALLSGGEVTVTVRGDGSGGPNQEFALAAGLELSERAVLASVDTDGRDGGTDVAGALVDVDTVDDPEAARDALTDNDSYPYLAQRDALLAVESATNVNDLRVLLLTSDRPR
jgi:hydroxypyruvate reductase